MAMRNSENTVGAEALGNSPGDSGGVSDGSAFWALAVETWRAEGVSVSEFCRREGLNVSSFYRWRRKLTAETSADGAKSTVSPGTSSSQDTVTDLPGDSSSTNETALLKGEQSDLSSDSTFVPVRLESVASEGGCSGAGSGVEILIDSHRVLRVDRGFDRETLRAVLSVLEAGAC